jgi:prophage maintenance system killer protein
MSIEVALIGDLLIIAEEDTVAPLADAEEAGSCADPVEEAALYGARIICRQPFFANNLEIAHAVLRQRLEEAGYPWPRAEEDKTAIEAMMKALQAKRISEAKFVDWVRLRVAAAGG